MTMEVYAEASEEQVRAAIGKLSDAMGGTGMTRLLYFAAVRHEKPQAPDTPGAFDLCALGRIRTCNLLIRSQMLYPLSYECLAVSGRFPSCPVGVAGTTLHDRRREVKSD